MFLAGAAATAAVCTVRASQSSLTASLRDAASAKGLLFGTEVNTSVVEDAQFAKLVARESSIVVPGWALKWANLQPSPEKFDFREADSYLQFAEQNRLLARGHVLVWHEAIPAWFNSVANAQNARKLLQGYISTVARRYAGKLHSWDVVNEIVQIKDGRPDGLRKSPWLELIGPEYIEMAFHAAHQADPTAFLVYNEDQLEVENRPTEIKRARVLALIKDLKRKGVPVHALGIQSHLPAEGQLGSPNFARFLTEVSDEGLCILVTEMDVFDQHMVGDIRQRDRLVAQRYYDHLSCVLRFPSVKAVLTWGLSNRYTWLAKHNPRQDGLPVRPLPFDAELKPTPACNTIRQAFEEARVRSSWIPQNTTNSRQNQPGT